MNIQQDDGPTVVLVEDDTDVRETLQEILLEENFSVQSFGEGQRALQALAAAPRLPKLLLLDLRMPTMDGFAFRAAQRQNPRLWQIPTVILSADSNVEDNTRDLEAQGFLRKPIHIQALLDLVGRYCSPV